jgi:hypothetical protein
MTKKFEIAGRPGQPPAVSTTELDHFISGEERMTTITVQIPERLKRALKRAALDRDMTIKDMLIELLEAHLAESKE